MAGPSRLGRYARKQRALRRGLGRDGPTMEAWHRHRGIRHPHVPVRLQCVPTVVGEGTELRGAHFGGCAPGRETRPVRNRCERSIGVNRGASADAGRSERAEGLSKAAS